MKLAKILADNQEYLKINNIEKAMGLKKTALVRMIARKEIPEKYKKQVEDWWYEFTKAISSSENLIDYKKPQSKNFDGKSIDKIKFDEVWQEPAKHEKTSFAEIERQLKEWQNKKCPSYMSLASFKKMQEKEIKELESQLK